MNRIVLDTLKTARNVLWELLVRHERGTINLRDWREQVNHAEKQCAELIDDIQETR